MNPHLYFTGSSYVAFLTFLPHKKLHDLVNVLWAVESDGANHVSQFCRFSFAKVRVRTACFISIFLLIQSASMSSPALYQDWCSPYGEEQGTVRCRVISSNRVLHTFLDLVIIFFISLNFIIIIHICITLNRFQVFITHAGQAFPS